MYTLACTEVGHYGFLKGDVGIGRMSVLEAAAEKLQAALLASLEEELPDGAQQQVKAKRKKEKKGRRTKKPAAQSELVQHASSQAESCTPSPDNSSSERTPAHPDGDAGQQQGRSSDAAAETNVAASGVAEARLVTEDAPRATMDTDDEQAHSSSGEAESTQIPALGLAGETTSEDEWKVCGHMHGLSLIFIQTSITCMGVASSGFAC